MYKQIDGDLLAMAKEGHFDVIAHGCNCQKMMGAGIAGQIAKQFPEAYEIDKKDIRTPTQRLGDMTTWFGPNFTVANLYTQYNGGKDLNYYALALSLYKLNKKFKGNKIGIPLIGCGIAGGEWPIVKAIIQKELKDCDVTVVIYNRADLGLLTSGWFEQVKEFFRKK